MSVIVLSGMVDSFRLTSVGVGCVGLASVSALASPLFFVGAGHYRDRTFACQENCCATAHFSQNAILWAMKIISTTEAARRLNVSPSRIRAMIGSGRLKAIKVGKVWLIDPKDLDAVKERKVGRPRKSRKSRKL
jgi:excisionase family DNA binding protein